MPDLGCDESRAEDAVEGNESVLDPGPVPLRMTASRRRLDAWTLVLVSKGVAPFIHWAEGMFELYVRPSDRALAAHELDAADAEEHQTRRAAREDAARAPRPESPNAFIGAVLVALILLAFFAVTGPRTGGSPWFVGGASDAERVLQGDWWRPVTALTLYADSAHVLSNVGLGTLAVGAVMRSEGVGWGAALVLASGVTGNVVNAWAHQSLHSSVGFSTAVFGAIGLLGGLRYMGDRRRALRSRPAWTALGAALALLALMGSSESSDLYAHLFGAMAGVGLGLAAGFLDWRPKTTLAQWAAGAASASVVVFAWATALGH